MAAAFDDTRLDGMRRSSGLSVNREGRVCHDGEVIAHPRVAQVFQAGLDVAADGAAIVRVDEQWAYVACDRTPFVVTRARLDPEHERLHVILNTGEELELAAADVSLGLEGDSDLFLSIHDGQHEARFGRAAWTQVAHALETGPGERVCLVVGSRRIAIEGGRASALPPARVHEAPHALGARP